MTSQPAITLMEPHTLRLVQGAVVNIDVRNVNSDGS